MTFDKEQMEAALKDKNKEIRTMMEVHTENALEHQTKIKKMKTLHEEQCRELMNSLEKVTWKHIFATYPWLNQAFTFIVSSPPQAEVLNESHRRNLQDVTYKATQLQNALQVSEETVQVLNKELLELKKQEEDQMKNHGKSIRHLEEIVSLKAGLPTSRGTLCCVDLG